MPARWGRLCSTEAAKSPHAAVEPSTVGLRRVFGNCLITVSSACHCFQSTVLQESACPATFSSCNTN